SANGSGTDCPTGTCTAGRSTITGEQHCETTKHPTYGPYTTIGLIASVKDVMSVGAVNPSDIIAGFSSRGPTRDGRVKPEIVAQGTNQFSTTPNNTYATMQGTSMSSPVITGTSALFVEQWRKTFNGQSPSPQEIKTLFIAGADDLGNPGPDYIYGFGLADAQKSVDLITADGGTGSRIRTTDIAQGQQISVPFTVPSTENVRLVLAWTDPEILPGPDETAEKTLVNDLDLTVVDPNGNTVFPYILDPNNPSANATRGPNHTDNIEELEIPNAAPGAYQAIVTGNIVAVGATQRYTLVSNAPFGSAPPPCVPPTTPTQLASAIASLGHFCSASDVNTFLFTASGAGSVTLATSDTAVKMTVVQTGTTTTIAANSSGTLQTPSGAVAIQVSPAGSLGTSATYTIVATYPFAPAPRTRGVRH
ncbi:MAG TPA: S8 family serine peptidase, partial [Thermoanaerobaculia bacterium]|nr:S8 family serine peptidase [Thermoanaerobaculia bacterium]